MSLTLKCVVKGCKNTDHAPYLIADGHGQRGGPACQEHHSAWLQQFHEDMLNTGAWLEAEAKARP